MRPLSERRLASALLADGHSAAEVSRMLGIPASTVREWARSDSECASRGRGSGEPGERINPGGECPGCVPRITDTETYAYLLGVYLGDGTIDPYPRGVYRLRVVCDLSYPAIIEEVTAAITSVRGSGRVGFARQQGCVDVNSYWKHWPCAFPQHGPGRKHDRPIRLVPWQEALVARNLQPFVRGLIHSDGCRHLNTVARSTKEGTRRYRYARYIFTNTSADILRLFTDALDSLGIHWTQANDRNISVARRHDVERLDAFVGPKA